tara:strand:- start:14 stop:535 length:522 start_codon:yes stop_codon:yes gene_type:complete
MSKLFLFTIFSLLISAEFKSERQYGIEQQLHAPCCWGGVIAEHDSPLAEAIKSVINSLIQDRFNMESVNQALMVAYENQNILDYAKNFIKQNMTDDEIINFFVGIHGEKIRALPENKGLGWIAWKLPTFLLFLSLLIGIIVVNRFQKNGKQTNPNIDQSKINSVDNAMKEMGI